MPSRTTAEKRERTKPAGLRTTHIRVGCGFEKEASKVLQQSQLKQNTLSEHISTHRSQKIGSLELSIIADIDSFARVCI